MVDLRRRQHRTERMDDPDFPARDYARCLADLERVNRLTLTHRPTLGWLERATAGWPAGTAVSVLDVGFGHGDLLRAIGRWAGRRRLVARLEGIDSNPEAARRAASASAADAPAIAWRTGDVFDHHPTPAPDFIVSSQFTHHLADPDLVRFLRWMERHSARGWFVSDLRRSAWAYRGFPVLCRLAGWHPVVRLDGTASIARSFRPDDWRRLLHDAGVDALIQPRFPSRLCVGRLR